MRNPQKNPLGIQSRNKQSRQEVVCWRGIMQQVFCVNADQVKLLAQGLDDRPVISEEEAKLYG